MRSQKTRPGIVVSNHQTTLVAIIQQLATPAKGLGEALNKVLQLLTGGKAQDATKFASGLREALGQYNRPYWRYIGHQRASRQRQERQQCKPTPGSDQSKILELAALHQELCRAIPKIVQALCTGEAFRKRAEILAEVKRLSGLLHNCPVLAAVLVEQAEQERRRNRCYVSNGHGNNGATAATNGHGVAAMAAVLNGVHGGPHIKPAPSATPAPQLQLQEG